MCEETSQTDEDTTDAQWDQQEQDERQMLEQDPGYLKFLQSYYGDRA